MPAPDWIFPADFDVATLSLYAGFVYLITHVETGRAYVGRKYLKAKRGRTTVESDWRRYWSSSKELKAEFKANGHDGWTREIISFHRTKGEVNYAEVAEQFRRDVLHARLADGSRAYFNKNIMARWFAGPETLTPEHRAKISAANKGRPASEKQKEFMRSRVVSQETRDKLSASAMGNQRGLGKTKTPEARAAIAERMTGLIRSDETRAKIAEANRARGPRTEAEKTKISASMRGVPKSQETKAKMKVAQAGHPGPSREAIEKSAAARRGKPSHNAGKPMSDEQRAKLKAGQEAYWARYREMKAEAGRC